jgi:hypothetical protein
VLVISYEAIKKNNIYRIESNTMALSQLTIILFSAIILTTYAAQLPAPFKQCTGM